MEIQSVKKCCECNHFYSHSMSPIAYCTHEKNSDLIRKMSDVIDERNDLLGNCKRAGLLFEPYVPKNASWFMKWFGG